jgi:DNA polymerase I-like protein with 3'-5' exonuclease and polymerase domains
VQGGRLQDQQSDSNPILIWQLPARLVGPYAEIDAVRTLEVSEILRQIVEREGTRDAYRLEVDLLPMVLEMRRRGIRIDQDAAEQAYDTFIGKRDAALTELSDQHGAAVSMAEIQGRKWLEKTFDGYGISYPRTAKGNPSFSTKKSGWMAEHEHWLPRGIAVAKKYNHAGETFIRGHILSHIVNGRIYGEIRPHLSDEGGTISFRFSYSNPPLQQMPKRDDEIGPLIRSAFLPEEGEFWATADASQQEFRGWVHYGVQHGLPSAQAAAKAYRNDPDTDFHKLVGEMTGLGRDTAKTANFAKGYGSGVETFAKTIGKSREEATAIMAQYDARLPFVAKLFRIEQEKASRTGITRLYDGALRHWNLYAPSWQDKNACSFEEARRRVTDPGHSWHGQPLGRAGVRKAFNALVQGLGARHTKLWMRAVFQQTGTIPLLQMHDSLECSVTSREQGEMIARLGEEAVSLNVPMQVGLKFGKTWGDAVHSWEELTGEAAPTKPAPTGPLNGAKPAIALPRQPALVIPPRPALVIPPPVIPPRPAIATPSPPPAQSENKRKPPLDDTEIDLADLVDCPVPRDRMILCPFHGETKPSMRIYPDHYYCFGCHAHGDHVDWLVKVEGLEYDRALDAVDNWDGPVIPRSQTRDAEEDARRTAYALTWWDAAKPIKATLAARYLAEVRGIEIDALPANIDEALRFHPTCVFGPGTRHPCLLALMRNPTTGEPTGIQRTALTADAWKIDRMMLGISGVVQLWPASSQLAIGEGLETVLAAATRLDYRGEPLRPAWAALSDGALKQFQLIDGVERLILLADNDCNNAGQIAAEACKQRWLEAGRRVALLTPDLPDTDFNDVVLAHLERAP